jgi:citrate synthase
MNSETLIKTETGNGNGNGNGIVKMERKGGLQGIVAATTSISRVDGEAGKLVYRGYDIHDLVQGDATFEEAVFLLWHGHLPNINELNQFKAELTAGRELPDRVLESLKLLLEDSDPMNALRTAVSVWGANLNDKATYEEVLRLTASVPVFLAAFHRLRNGLEPLAPKAGLGHAANYLYMMSGEIPAPKHERALDAYLVMLADHDMNASTFTARVVASTWSDLASCVTAAVGALKGPLHGGAPGKVLQMLEAIGTPDNAENWLRDALAKGERIMGFGHRMYKTEDPRAVELHRLSKEAATSEDYALAERVETVALEILHEHRPQERIYTNVEYYSAVLLHTVGLPYDMFSPTFAAARTAGWTAHILEQLKNNRLIRPEAEYTGALTAQYLPLAERNN